LVVVLRIREIRVIRGYFPKFLDFRLGAGEPRGRLTRIDLPVDALGMLMSQWSPLRFARRAEPSAINRHSLKLLVEVFAVRKFVVVFLDSFTSLLIQGSAYGALVYQLADLGTLGGNSSYGTAINDHGTAVGYSTVPGGATHAFRWSVADGIVDIGNTGGGNSKAFDINNADNIVGQTSNQAFRWKSDTGMVLIDVALTFGTANDLNESSEAIGTRDDGGGRTIRWDASNTTSSPFPLTTTQGVAINNLNQFVGLRSTGGYYSTGMGITNLVGFLPTDINDSREVVGSAGDVAALLDFDSSSTTLLGKLSLTDSFSRALGINEAGTIVGVSEGTGAFIYDSSMGGLQNLTSLLAAEHSGWTILAAEDINNLGQIVGVGRFNGVDHAVVLTPIPEPVPEPGAVIVSAVILGMLPWRRRWIAL
jgi:probable HAF family extracellular repeat protein